jgi:uncharacterized membrane protein (UPF0136 family)
MALMAWIAFESSFGFQEWLLFAALALGAIALAYFAPALYGFAPWAAMAINAVMLAGWFPQESSELLTALIAFGSLYVLSGFLLISGSVTPLLWAGLSVSAALGYYLIGFFRLTPSRPEPEPLPINVAPSTEPASLCSTKSARSPRPFRMNGRSPRWGWRSGSWAHACGRSGAFRFR